MRRSTVLIAFLLAGVVVAGWAQAAEVEAKLPVLVTSCGQSPGPVKFKVFLKRLEYDHVYDLGATAALLDTAKKDGKPFGSVIIVTGASLKGMGAAGVSIGEELQRIEALIAAAKKQAVAVIGAHVEGMARRAQGAAAGDNSDEMSIDAVCPKSDLLIVRKDGNEDGRFTKISEAGGMPVIEFEKNMELGNVLEKLYGN